MQVQPAWRIILMAEKIDIEYLTSEAEKFNGTAVGNVLDKVAGLEERLQILRQMDAANEKHRQSNPNLPDLYISFGARRGDVGMRLTVDPSGWFNSQTIYSENYCPHNNTRTRTYTQSGP